MKNGSPLIINQGHFELLNKNTELVFTNLSYVDYDGNYSCIVKMRNKQKINSNQVHVSLKCINQPYIISQYEFVYLNLKFINNILRCW